MSVTWGYSVPHGVIINTNIKSTVHAALERVPPVPDDQLPKVRTLSDLQYSLWAASARYEGPGTITNLEWYFVASIANEETRQIIKGALLMQNFPGLENGSLSPWMAVVLY
jgi:hypothetical protein